MFITLLLDADNTFYISVIVTSNGASV